MEQMGFHSDVVGDELCTEIGMLEARTESKCRILDMDLNSTCWT